MTPTILIASTTNRFGIEVHLEGLHGVATTLCAYRNGRLSARMQLGRAHGRLVDASEPELVEDVEERVSPDLRAALVSALEEGLRISRDGRGLCEANRGAPPSSAAVARRGLAERREAGNRFALTVVIATVLAAERGAERLEAEDIQRAIAHVRGGVSA